MILLGTLLAFIVAIAGWMFILLKTARAPVIAAVCLGAFLLRFGLAWVNVSLVELPGSGQDDQAFHDVASQLSVLDWPHLRSELRTGKPLYEVLVGATYKIVGINQLLPLTVNVMSGTLTVLFVWLLSSALWRSGKTALIASMLAACFPTLAIYSGLLLRDSLVIFALTAGAYYLVIFLQAQRPTSFAAAIGFWVVAISFHTGAIAVLPALGLAPLLSRQTSVDDRRGNVVSLTVMVVLSLVVVLAIFSTGWGMDKLRRYQDMEMAEALAAQQTRKESRARAGYLEDLQPQSSVDLLWQTPIRVLYFVGTPFPWMIQSGKDIFGVLTAAATLGIILLNWRSRRAIAANKCALLVLFAACCLMTVFAVGTANYGTAIRHRSKAIPLLLATIPSFRLRLSRYDGRAR
jgi:4-amino-4-deoxy-L-arabinose transferase-like glycosyltransferase